MNEDEVRREVNRLQAQVSDLERAVTDLRVQRLGMELHSSPGYRNALSDLNRELER